MDRNDCIIPVSCLVCEHYRVIQATYPLRRGGFAPARTDEEVITMDICGEYVTIAVPLFALSIVPGFPRSRIALDLYAKQLIAGR